MRNHRAARGASDLHVCGDDPAWQSLVQVAQTVISTYVEMIPHYISPIYKTVGDLHVCGDDPKQIDKLNLAVL